MAILVTLPGPNLFSSLPTNPPPQNDPSPTPKPPIPIPKYPPPFKKSKPPPNPQSPPAFKSVHRRSNYYKPVRDGVISTDGDRSVVVGESGLSYQLPGAPFEFQFSYSETPKVKPLAIREPAFLPFAPPTMPRPWTGKAPMKKSKRKIKLFGQSAGSDDDDEDDDDDGDNGGMKLEMLKAYQLGNFVMRPREEVLGKPLTRMEIKELIRRHLSSNRQVNLGRDGLTHNMLELIHTHWRRDPVCKVRCLGVPTVDMKNVCRCLEEKTGGKIIYRVGGVIYLFRGRNYDHRARPKYPVMLWKPATPVYPKLIQDAPEGLTKDEADELRKKGKNLLPICKLAKNGVYMTLVRDVKHAFEQCPLVKVDCTGMHASDYKKIGAKLKELVPCVLLSFDEEQILMWRGHNWKSMYRNASSASSTGTGNVANKFSTSEHNTDKPDESKTRTVTSSPKMMSLWKKALDSNKAMVLDDIGLGPDALLKVIEEFTSISQAAEHSYPALITSEEKEEDEEEDQSQSTTNREEDEYDEDETYDSDYNDQYDLFDSAARSGSLPVDAIANRLHDSKKWGSNRDFR